MKSELSMLDKLAVKQMADRSPGYVEETLESAGCTGGCPMYPGAPMSDDGMPDCSKCPQWDEE